ncbi:MAG TPA: ankyrin repeat domain-containing protein [Candidatus Acidoferrales bacterium]|nr:ankyrin repeat domain-containing protein [Candidatus Acidoferrales bacterium]
MLMLMLMRLAVLTTIMSALLWAQNESHPTYPAYKNDVARQHEKSHRDFITVEGVDPGANFLYFTIVVSPTGDVMGAFPDSDSSTANVLRFWPQVEGEIRQWKFIPFEQNGKAVTAQVEEHLILIPADKQPKNRASAPVVRPNSEVTVTLHRSGSYWGGPTYTVTVGTDGIVFDGRSFVVAPGKHTATVDAGEVRRLAQSFVDAKFYSMNEEYVANNISDLPSSMLSISIDGHSKRIKEYGGFAAGMPRVISKLQDAVYAFAQTQRWVEGADGLIPALQEEKFNFQSFEAQVMLKLAANRGSPATVRGLLNAGVALEPLPAPIPSRSVISFFGELRHLRAEEVGWLSAASNRPEVLQVFLDARASNHDQDDKDRALADAASAGNLKSVQMLIAYGANVNAEANSFGDKRSVLILAAESGNPDVVREVLRYHPQLEARDGRGRTAMFSSDEHGRDSIGNHVECVRLLAQAGADVSARDDGGNTPLHVTFLADAAEELLKLGADVNARNNAGETPIFTTLVCDAIPMLIAHGADLTIRNNKGQTALEAATLSHSPYCDAMDKLNRR